MDKEDEVLLERRLTTLEMGIEEVKRNSEERLDAIMARFDNIDRRNAWWVTSVFTICLAIGGIYLEAYLNKEDKSTKPTPIVIVDGM